MAVPPATLREQIAWAYANLAMAHKAVTDGASRYGTLHYMIRARLYKGLRTGTMNLGSLLDDERVKYLTGSHCAYCGATGSLTIDHIVPRVLGGLDGGDNFLPACRRCNSAKGAKDLLVWMAAEESFPSLSVLRRYLKLAHARAAEMAILDIPIAVIDPALFPFALHVLPAKFPPPPTLHWAHGG